MIKLTQKHRLLSFDLDNTLYDNQPVIEKAEAESKAYLFDQFQQQEQPFDFDEFLTIRKKLLTSGDRRFENMSAMRLHALEIFCQNLTHSQPIIEQAFRIFLDYRSQVTVEESIEQLLIDLNKSYNLVSVTNGNCDVTKTSLVDHFHLNLSASDNFRAKPHPEMLHKAMTHFNVKPEQVLHIGDSLTDDGEAAKAAKVDFFHLTPFIGGQFNQTELNNLRRLLLSDSP